MSEIDKEAVRLGIISLICLAGLVAIYCTGKRNKTNYK